MPTDEIEKLILDGDIFIQDKDGQINKIAEIQNFESVQENNQDDAADAVRYAIEKEKSKSVSITITREASIQMQKMLGVQRITRKRFIKLIMSKGYQRNKANKMHQEYMEKYKYRTMIGLMVFLECYNIKPIFKLKIGEKIFEGEMRYEKGNDISSR